MTQTSRAAIESFLKLKRIAVVGASRKERSYSRMVCKALTERGYEVAPVHPEAAEVGGMAAFPSVAAIAPAVEGVLVLTRKESYAAVAEDCRKAGVAQVWYRFAAPAGGAAVENECPLMWMDHPDFIHSLHKGLRQLVGTLPK